MMFPGLPLGRSAPWVLGGVSAALIGLGAWQGDRPLLLLGGVGLLAVLVAFPLSSAVMGERPDDGEAGPGANGENDRS